MTYDRTKLTPAELEQFLRAHPGWKQQGDAIVRTIEFPTFLEGVAFVQKIAEVAEQNDHHPDIDIRWRKVSLLLTTHDAGGLTFRDPKVASEIDALLGR